MHDERVKQERITRRHFNMNPLLDINFIDAIEAMINKIPVRIGMI